MNHSAKAGLGTTAGAGILETLGKSGPRRGRGGRESSNHSAKAGLGGAAGAGSLKHLAKVGLGGAAGAEILEPATAGLGGAAVAGILEHSAKASLGGARPAALASVRILGAQAPGRDKPPSPKIARAVVICVLVCILSYENHFPRPPSVLVMLALAFTVVPQLGCLSFRWAASAFAAAGAGILEAHGKSGPRPGRRGKHP